MNYWDNVKLEVKDIEVILNMDFYDEDDFIDCCNDFVQLLDNIDYFDIILHDSHLNLNEALKLLKISCGENSKEVSHFLDFHEKVLGSYGIEFKQIFKYCLDNHMVK